MNTMLEYLAWTLLAVAFLCVFALHSRQARLRRTLRGVPGSPPTFLIGNLSWILGLYAAAKRSKYHPGVYIALRIWGSGVLYRRKGFFCVWFGIQPIVAIFKSNLLELVLGSSVSLEKSFEYTFLQKWLGTGLLTSNGGKWRHRRKLLTPSFHFRILEDFLPVFHHQSMVLVEKLDSLRDREYVDIEPLVILCTLDVICETVMGVSIGAQKGNNSEYVEAIHSLADYFNKRMSQPWLWSDFLFGLTSMGKKYNRNIDILHNFTDKVIKEKKEKLLSTSTAEASETRSDEASESYGGKKRRTFMDLLLDMHVNGEQLSEADIREEVDTFMFEGHDTTAMGIIYALYLIGLYPEVQKKIADELREIFGEDADRPLTYDDARNMKYLECALKESQRLFPSVPIIGRKLNEDIHYDGVTIPKHTTVHCNFLCLHMDPDVFPNPDVFDPDRFLPENSLKRHPYAYLPFSAGPRNCIGQKFAMLEEKTIVSSVLRRFHITSLDPRDQFHVKVEFTLRPAQEVRLRFTPRQTNR